MYTEILNELGLAKNEGFIYVALVKQGGMGIATIAVKSGVHRRNVYDSMQRLLEKGLVYEEIGDRENIYFAVDPHKLLEMVEEKRSKVESLMPELLKQFKAATNNQSVAIYRGIEGVKNYLRLMEREGEEIFLYGALGGSLSPKLAYTFKHFTESLEKRKITANVLYRNSVIHERPEIIGHMGKTSKNRVLSKEYDDTASYVVFGDYICLQSGQYSEENFEKEGEVVLFMLKSKNIAEMMRGVFKMSWKVSEEFKQVTKK